MNVAIVGYGKMGHMIHNLCTEMGHVVTATIDVSNAEEIQGLTELGTEVVIEFSGPDSAFDNILDCLKQGLPVVTGSTGWLDRLAEVEDFVKEQNGTFLYASNFSLGVNLFFKLNKMLTQLMAGYPQYLPTISEIHHVHKKDAPSGTAITLAEDLIDGDNRFQSWELNELTSDNAITVKSIREGEVPGTHIINYSSREDSIEIRHEAFGRKGFAIGAIMVADWIRTKKGILSMDDFLDR